MSIPMQKYLNPSAGTLRLEIGNAPGGPPTVYTSEPGESCVGPICYEKAFNRVGFVAKSKATPGQLNVSNVVKPTPPKPTPPKPAPKPMSKSVKPPGVPDEPKPAKGKGSGKGKGKG